MKIEPISSAHLNSQSHKQTSDRWEQYLRNREYLPKEKRESEILQESSEPPDEHFIGWA